MTLKSLVTTLITLIALLSFAASVAHSTEKMPETFVDITDVIPDAVLEIRYFGEHNFLGARVDGYLAPKCLLTRPAAQALALVQNELRPFSLTLKIYDCYRPQQAVDHFVRWANDVTDTKTRLEFYPAIDKANLFKDGYIAYRSGHSRGSTVDLTVVPVPLVPQPPYDPAAPQVACYEPVWARFPDNSLDMGTGFDCFHEMSHTLNPQVGPTARANRLLLKTLMEKHGFKPYDLEWWHFSLAAEPYPDTYFNFPVK